MNKKLLQIARRYHEKCIREYKKVCTGRGKRGDLVPANKKEADRIRYIIKFELEWIKDVYSFDGIKRGDIDKAIREYRRSL